MIDYKISKKKKKTFFSELLFFFMTEKLDQEKVANSTFDEADFHIDDNHGPEPTEEDWKNCREVADKVPISAYLVIVIEFCERFTYYGLSGPFQNYIQNPAPESCKYEYFIL